jgi:hypothetical protein
VVGIRNLEKRMLKKHLTFKCLFSSFFINFNIFAVSNNVSPNSAFNRATFIIVYFHHWFNREGKRN